MRIRWRYEINVADYILSNSQVQLFGVAETWGIELAWSARGDSFAKDAVVRTNTTEASCGEETVDIKLLIPPQIRAQPQSVFLQENTTEQAYAFEATEILVKEARRVEIYSLFLQPSSCALNTLQLLEIPRELGPSQTTQQTPRMEIPQVQDSSIRYLKTSEAYDLWADVYDTDGNFLQALDTIQMKSLLPRMLALLESSNLPRPWKLVDLGCGTGRNTAALLEVGEAQVVGLDVSAGMLQVARQRLKDGVESGRLQLEVLDLIEQSVPPPLAKGADAVVSTLVIEHIPADRFFRQISQMLKPGGILLLTNMHSEMGGISQAGFIDPKTGDKIRPASYAHTVDDVEAEAAKYGLEVIDKIEEKSVDASMVSQLGERSAKWVGVRVWFGGILRRTW